MVGVGLPLLTTARVRGEAEVGFAHQTYLEDHDRITVNTETVRAAVTLAPWMDVTVRGVYDAISGATPTGAPSIDQLRLRSPVTHAPVPNSSITGFTRLIDAVSGASQSGGSGSTALSHSAIPLAESHDIRRGGDLSLGFTFGPSRVVPTLSYSAENDYISWAGGLTYSLELNEKNTVVSAGWSHAYDRVLPNSYSYITERQIKNTDEFTLGVTQLLGPKTVLSVTGTLGHAEGYLNDPYRGVVFEETPLNSEDQVVLSAEKRPETRDSQALFLSVNRAVTELNASVEGSYRFYHDSYGIIANTWEVAWLQKIGRWAVLSPSFRYYRQTAADFYGIQFPGDPDFDPASVPEYYSADYRLSALQTFTVGLEGTFHLCQGCDLRLGYKRYWMQGLDHVTQQSTYPDANIFTAGISYTF
jgi:hypothetical protein